ncbi:MAG: ACR3 family arsenite efflux transporter [Alphaproteobacteria bacterium]|nr:ACR3 family arsenite efflux transporter [Alphaproteobacteria bacterium]
MTNSPLGFFERYLSIWVALCIAAGVGLGHLIPSVFQAVAHIEYASVNLVVAVLIWVMIYPMMVNVDFSTIGEVRKSPKGLLITFFINWFVKPFSMAALGVLFLQYVFAPFIPAEDAKQYIAGLILLGTAPCTAMVFVWSRLVNGNANYTLVQVSLNDLVMIFAYAPVAALLLGISDIAVPWETLLLSVALYVIIPIVAGYITRRRLLAEDEAHLTSFLDHLKPYSVIGLLATVVLLFGFQAETLLQKPLVIGMIAVPILLQSVLMFALTYIWMCKSRIPHNVAAPAALIGGSNFFELAVAVAISLFGLHSGAARATVVGVLVEVPAMLWLVAIANRTQHRFNA